MKVYVGVDWSAKELVVATAIGNEKPASIRKTRRTMADVRDLLQRIRQRHQGASEIHVFIEAGAIGWVELLNAAGAVVYVCDPQQVKSFAASLSSSKAKDDRRDSKVLARFGQSRCHELKVWRPDNAVIAQLKSLAGMHESTTKELTRTKQRLRAHLRERFSRLEAALNDLSRQWVWRLLLQYPTPWHARRLTSEDFAAHMKGSGASQKSLAAALKALQLTEADWLTEISAEAFAFEVRTLVDRIKFLSTQLKSIEEKLDAASVDEDARLLLESADGISMKMSNRLLELVFDPDNLPVSRDDAGIKLGACPVAKTSGNTSSGQPKGSVRMRKSVSSRCKQTVYLLGRLASQHIPWARARYAWDIQHGKNAATSYRIIARSLLRILTAMLRTGEPYDDARYVALLQKQGLPWAMDLEA